jgi:hypothetical protein
VIEPATCQMPGASADPSVTGLAGSTTHFFTPDLHFVEETVASFTADPSPVMVDPLVDYVARCPSITASAADGSTTVVAFTSIAAPAVGERSMAYTMDVTQTAGTATAHFWSVTIVVVVGHTAVAFIAGGADELDPALVDKLVETATAKVEAAA